MGKSDSETAPEIEITDAMMKAGILAYSNWDRRFEDSECLVYEIYEAMEKAKP